MAQMYGVPEFFVTFTANETWLMGSMAQTGLLLVPSDALGHTWALLGALGGGQGLPQPTGPRDLITAERPLYSELVDTDATSHVTYIHDCLMCTSPGSPGPRPPPVRVSLFGLVRSLARFPGVAPLALPLQSFLVSLLRRRPLRPTFVG